MRALLTAALLALALLQTLISQAQDNCPPGQMPLCMGACVCVADFQQLQREALELAAGQLAGWLTQSRQTALMAGSQPMPLPLRAALVEFYDAELLDNVRYRVGAGDELDVATAMLQNPDVQAVTLIDLVVFRDAVAAEQDVALWAHELWHVQQFQQWGVHGFARRYVQDHAGVEQPAYAMQARVRQLMRQQARERDSAP